MKINFIVYSLLAITSAHAAVIPGTSSGAAAAPHVREIEVPGATSAEIKIKRVAEAMAEAVADPRVTRFCLEAGQSCGSKLKRAAEAVAEAVAEPKRHGRFCLEAGQPCGSKLKRSLEDWEDVTA